MREGKNREPKNKEPKLKYLERKNCTPQETDIKNVRLAMAYIPFQILCELFKPLEALNRGTAFPELYSPYKGKDKSTVERSRSSNERRR